MRIRRRAGPPATGEEEKETADGNSDADGSASGSGTGSSGAGVAGVQSTSGSGVNLNFGEDSKLVWPVNGTVLMSYSMDKTVYFSTLDQYKYNPALIISAAENDQVIAGTTGIVKSIDNMAETGTTVNIDIGNGYELLYGQLKDVPLKVGDYVEANTVIGYVSKPTKYYSVEGTNVYFENAKGRTANQPAGLYVALGDGDFRKSPVPFSRKPPSPMGPRIDKCGKPFIINVDNLEILWKMWKSIN